MIGLDLIPGGDGFRYHHVIGLVPDAEADDDMLGAECRYPLRHVGDDIGRIVEAGTIVILRSRIVERTGLHHRFTEFHVLRAPRRRRCRDQEAGMLLLQCQADSNHLVGIGHLAAFIGIPVQSVKTAQLVVEIAHAVHEGLRLGARRKTHAVASAADRKNDLAILHAARVLDIAHEIGRRASTVIRQVEIHLARRAG